MTQTRQSYIIAEIWRSFLALPTWVQIWILLILAPVNMASLAFLDQPSGGLIAILALGGMTLSAIIIIAVRGFTRLVSGGHVLLWTPLVLILALTRPDATGIFGTYLNVLLVVNSISLIFDFNDLRRWLCGERTPA